MIGMRVTWTTADTVRAIQERERWVDKQRDAFSSSRHARIMYRDFDHWLDDQPHQEVTEYVTVHRGRVLAIAYQPAQVALASSSRLGQVKHEIKAGWVALVAREDGRIVSMDPTELREDTSSPVSRP